jgi:hypothetical protein
MNKLSLVGMQLPVKYKENFDVSSEGPSSGVLRWKRRKSPYIFRKLHPYQRKLVHIIGTRRAHIQYKIISQNGR